VPLEDLEAPRFVGTAETPPPRPDRRVELAVLLAAILGHLPALGTWWTLDDWGLLGRAAGLLDSSAPLGFPARWLSQHLYWDTAYPLFGLAPDPYTWSRLILHGLGAWLTVRIAERAGVAPAGRLLAGVVVAATPLVFTPVYWAAGIQELLAAFLALLAVERWLAGGRRNLALAVLAGALGMLAKESGLGLPVLFLAFLWLRVGMGIQDKAFGWALTFLLMMAALAEGVLVTGHIATGQGDPYALGGLRTVVTNLGVFGWWLISPGPLLAGRILWPMTAAGAMFFVGWGAWAWNRWHQGHRLPAGALLAALLVLAPALGLQNQLHPYLAYLATPAVGLALGSLLPGRWNLRLPVLVLAAVAAAGWSFWSMEVRLGQRDSQGLPADPVVKGVSLSWKLCRELEQLPMDRGQAGNLDLILLQVPATDEAADLADRLGDRWVAGTHVHEALGGAVGPRLVLARKHQRPIGVRWANALFTGPGDALVLCAHGPGFKHWGNTPNAAFYAAMTDVGLGRFERARKHLIRGGQLQSGSGRDNDTASFFYDGGQMVVPLENVLARKEEFIDWTAGLLAQGRSPQEVGGLQEVFLQLLVAATGQTYEELTAGSTPLDGSSRQPDPEPNPGE
jgi:hypothetical protein